uniref:Paired domain-containing protein n=1 Tax=Ascaris lumbricoides TaxID=6252 RepID=A0A0M3HEX4_ASCLU
MPTRRRRESKVRRIIHVTSSAVVRYTEKFDRFRTTGSVRPKDAKEGRTESPLVIAIRDYRARLGMSRQSEIREQLIADGICSRENAPSRSSINQFVGLFLLLPNSLFIVDNSLSASVCFC